MNIKHHLFSLLLFYAACSDENDGKKQADANGLLSYQLTHDEISRSFSLYVPENYSSEKPASLLFNFHGFGDTAEQYINYADMRSLAESEQFILVYPQGSCLNGSSHWNPCLVEGDNKSTADDLGFVEAMIDDISSW